MGLGMGMSSQSGSSDTTSSSQTEPWKPAIPFLSNILGNLGGVMGVNNGNPGAGAGMMPTTDQQNWLSQMQNNAATVSNDIMPEISRGNKNLLSGGGALNQSGNVDQSYQNYYNQTNPLASNTNYDPMSTPGIGTQLQTLQDDIQRQLGGQFAAAGRDMSGMDQQTRARGLAQGLAPVLTQQYNQNVQNQQGAASNLYQAGLARSAAQAGMQNTYNQNYLAGLGAIPQSIDAANAGGNAIIQAQTAGHYGIPAYNMGLLANIGIPIAGLGNQTNSKSHTDSSSSGTSFSGGLNLFSDRRLKEDIAQVGSLYDGTPVYRYRYKGHKTFQIGLMAQDIEDVTPEAVGEAFGFKTVDYKKATDKVAR